MSEDWDKYQKLVLSELQRLNKMVETVQTEQSAMRSDIELLKLKASMYGAIGGIASTIIAVVTGNITKSQ